MNICEQLKMYFSLSIQIFLFFFILITTNTYQFNPLNIIEYVLYTNAIIGLNKPYLLA